MDAIVLATGNAGKIREFTRMLADFKLTVHGLGEYPELGDIPETGDTFLENALIKARAVSQATGLVAVADDSGLEVDALGGAPGVYSARYSGEDANPQKNNEKLLRELAGTPFEKRTARFRCVIVAMAPDGRSISASGAWEGLIAEAPAGDNGFGYDPLFFDPELGTTAAQLAPDVKNARSHRGLALKALLEEWPDFWHKISTK